MSKSAIKILWDPTVPWDRWDCPWESTVPPEEPHIPLSILSHCTMGQVGLSMGVHCPTWGPPYPTVRPIPQYHGTGGTIHGSPLSLLKGPISHCPSYPTVPWDRWDCPWESTVPPEGPHIPLSVLSHSTMGQVGLSMGVHCPTWGPPYPTVPWDRWDCPWESTVPPEGHHIPLSVLSHCTMGQVGLSMGVHCPTWGPPYPTVRPIPLYHGTGGIVHGSPLSHLRAPYPTVRPIPLYHGTTSNYNYNALSVNCEQDWKVSATVQFLLSPYKSRDNDGAPYSEEQHYSYLETLRERFRDPYLTVYWAHV